MTQIWRRRLAFAAVFVILANLALLLSGYRVLIGERWGEEFTPYVAFAGSTKIGDTLSCTYWTGRSIKSVEYSGGTGKPDECRFLSKDYYFGD